MSRQHPKIRRHQRAKLNELVAQLGAKEASLRSGLGQNCIGVWLKRGTYRSATQLAAALDLHEQECCGEKAEANRFLEQFREQLEAIVEARGNQAEAARWIGVSQDYVSRWRRKITDPSEVSMRQVANAYARLPLGDAEPRTVDGVGGNGAGTPSILARILEANRQAQPIDQVGMEEGMTLLATALARVEAKLNALLAAWEVSA